MPRVHAIEIVEDRTASSRCDEGFLHVRRYLARNRRADGSASSVYRIDVVDRPSLDAVAVCLWARTPRGVEVLLRRQLRPAVHFRAGRKRALPERDLLLFEELVAGVLEPGEHGLDAIKRRAAEEVREEAGISVAPEAMEPLGAGFYMLPGIVSEKIHLLAAEVDRGLEPASFDAPRGGRRLADGGGGVPRLATPRRGHRGLRRGRGRGCQDRDRAEAPEGLADALPGGGGSGAPRPRGARPSGVTDSTASTACATRRPRPGARSPAWNRALL